MTDDPSARRPLPGGTLNESWSGDVKPENVTNVNFLEQRMIALAERWGDPKFWDKEGSSMDSRDCAVELRAALRAAPPASPEGGDERIMSCGCVVVDGRHRLFCAQYSAVTEADLDRLRAELARVTEALTSIANNSCCAPCREAALVARAALK